MIGQIIVLLQRRQAQTGQLLLLTNFRTQKFRHGNKSPCNRPMLLQNLSVGLKLAVIVWQGATDKQRKDNFNINFTETLILKGRFITVCNTFKRNKIKNYSALIENP